MTLKEEEEELNKVRQRAALGEHVRQMYEYNRKCFAEPNDPTHVYTRGFHADQALQYLPLVMTPEDGHRLFQVDIITRTSLFQIEEDAIDFLRQREEKSERPFTDNGKRFFIKYANNKHTEYNNE